MTYMEISTYQQGHRRADVLRTSGQPENYWGVRYYSKEKKGSFLVMGIEWYPTKSESWAEDAAENYVMGIKSYPTQDLSAEG